MANGDEFKGREENNERRKAGARKNQQITQTGKCESQSGSQNRETVPGMMNQTAVIGRANAVARDRGRSERELKRAAYCNAYDWSKLLPLHFQMVVARMDYIHPSYLHPGRAYRKFKSRSFPGFRSQLPPSRRRKVRITTTDCNRLAC